MAPELVEGHIADFDKRHPELVEGLSPANGNLAFDGLLGDDGH